MWPLNKIPNRCGGGRDKTFECYGTDDLVRAVRLARDGQMIAGCQLVGYDFCREHEC